jgi:hypothetical protein
MNAPLLFQFVVSLLLCQHLFAAASDDSRLGGAKWIWHAEQGHAGVSFPKEVCYFRASFTASDKPGKTFVDLTADNLYKVYLNGTSIGASHANPDMWSSPKRFDLSKHLKPGRNLLALEASNTAAGPAGLILKVNGKKSDVVSDRSWKASNTLQKGWQLPGFNDEQWRQALVLGDYGMPPWGNFLRSGTKKKAAKKPAVIAELKTPADYEWPEGIVFVGDDCSLYSQKSKDSFSSLSVTVFSTRRSRAFPEHDLPAPVKVGHKLYRLSPARPGVEPTCILDAKTGALGSPTVSFDGKWIYLSMTREGDPFYHIYRLPATGGDPIQLTHGAFHDIDPAELPDGRIAFASTRFLQSTRQPRTLPADDGNRTARPDHRHRPSRRRRMVQNPAGHGRRQTRSPAKQTRRLGITPALEGRFGPERFLPRSLKLGHRDLIARPGID